MMTGNLSLHQQRSPLAACRLFESTDVDETREMISRVMQPHDLVPVGSMTNLRAHMDFLRLPGMGIGAIKFGHMRVNVEAIDGYHLILCCLSGSARIQADNGEAIDIDPRRGYYLPAGAPLRGEFSADCEQFVMRVDAETWRTQTGASSSRLNSVIDLSNPKLQPWLVTIRDLLAVPATIGFIQAHDSVARSYEQLLLHLLIAGQGMKDAPGKGVAPAVVTRAERYLKENSEEPLRLEDIAQAIGVPARTLLLSFQRFRGTSPMRYLRDLRLDRARALLAQGVGGTSVTNVALDCGFTHFGRFSQYYGQRYGEAPSETLARNRAQRFR